MPPGNTVWTSWGAAATGATTRRPPPCSARTHSFCSTSTRATYAVCGTGAVGTCMPISRPSAVSARPVRTFSAAKCRRSGHSWLPSWTSWCSRAQGPLVFPPTPGGWRTWSRRTTSRTSRPPVCAPHARRRGLQRSRLPEQPRTGGRRGGAHPHPAAQEESADILAGVSDVQPGNANRRHGQEPAGEVSGASADAGQVPPAQRETARSTVNRHHEYLLGGPPTYTIEEFAEHAGVEVGVARQYWRSLGFPDVPRGEKWFTQDDVTALRGLAETVNSNDVSVRASQDLVRGLGHSMDRLVLWQVEALVQDASSRFDLDDVSARLVVLDRLVALSPLLRELLDYVWRRHLLALLGRIDRDLSRAGRQGAEEDQLPLERAICFIDIVSYTARSADLTPSGLASLVQDFESAARDVVARYGGRVVKTIGDAVLFVADDLPVGARVATALAQVMGAQDLP